MKPTDIVQTNKGELEYAKVIELRRVNKAIAVDAGDKVFDGVMYCPKCLELGIKDTMRIISAAQCVSCNGRKSRKTPTKNNEISELKERVKKLSDMLIERDIRIESLEADEMKKEAVINDLRGQVEELNKENDELGVLLMNMHKVMKTSIASK